MVSGMPTLEGAANSKYIGLVVCMCECVGGYVCGCVGVVVYLCGVVVGVGVWVWVCICVGVVVGVGVYLCGCAICMARMLIKLLINYINIIMY